MNEQITQPETGLPSETKATVVRLAVGALVLVAIGLALLAILMWPRAGRALYPLLASPTAPSQVIENETLLVNFEELNADPARFRNQSIQVSGDYTPIDLPACKPLAGPRIEWSLVADQLQLNATGFENILRLVEPGLTMTVSGVWRLYQGPLGCGKEPPDGAVWYLEVKQILEPNPITGSVPVLLTFVPGERGDELPGAVVTPLEVTPGPDEQSTALPEIEVTILPTSTVGAEATAVPLATATPTLPTTPLATSQPGTPPPGGAATVPSGSPTPQSTPDPLATPTQGTGGTATPALPTGTAPPGGYPPPTATSEGGYP